MHLKKLPSVKKLNDLFEYDPVSGDITRKRTGNIIKTKERKGYINIFVTGSIFKGHRIAYKMFHGDFDESLDVDHINGCRFDNRISNLRLVKHEENCKNRSLSKNNTSGVIGVYWYDRLNKWTANIWNGQTMKLLHLGVFEDKDNAIKARKEAEQKLSFHPNHGKSLYKTT